MRQDRWNEGDVKECQIASRSSIPPDKRGDLLLCGSDTLNAWSVTWLLPGVKSQIYEKTSSFPVTFRSSGHSSRAHDTWWWCKRTLDRIDCD